ncbi:disulfide bond formation protein DsbA [Acidobacteria bacterium AB60]|nr:disulfide bond formation protein DsbA [Acidobacteria bacterium AB60]
MRRDAVTKLDFAVCARDHIFGADTARLTLVQYGDYETQACDQAHVLLKAALECFGDDLRVVFRHFPFNSHRFQAQRAAEAGEAAAAQRRFWEMHEVLFQNRTRLSDRHLRLYASHLGLDMPRFNRDMAAQTHVVRVREDFLSGVRSGVNESPAFFINGWRYKGPLDVASLHSAIEDVAEVAI